jgi:hypothetical protein
LDHAAKLLLVQPKGQTRVMKPRPSKKAGLVVALVIASVPLHALQAQELPPSLSNLGYTAKLDVTPHPPLRLELGDSTKYPRTYWLEGALIGGIPLALLGAALGGGLCTDPDNSGGGTESCWDDALLGLATGLGVGGSLGGLIGGLIKKPEKKDQKAPADAEYTASR